MTTAIYEPKDTALLVVDPYNDFMSEGGKMYAATKPTADSVGFYANMGKLLPAQQANCWPRFLRKVTEDSLPNGDAEDTEVEI